MDALSVDPTRITLEVGPGAGALTQALVRKPIPHLWLVEIDPDWVTFLKQAYPALQERILTLDFLQLAIEQLGQGPIAIIGNFPYYLSAPILFKILAHRQQVQEVVGMVQQEVAERLAAPPGSKTYGIPSVLLQAFYTIEYLFTVAPTAFKPQPKVHSAVIRLRRNTTQQLTCDEPLFCKLVKASFQQRRKKIRNALQAWKIPAHLHTNPLLAKRAEQLSVADFVALTQQIQHLGH